jgi:hypothetical protein
VWRAVPGRPRRLSSSGSAVFIGLRGLVIVFWFIRRKGSYCRDCGIATFRRMSSLTLAQGWWFAFGLLAVPVILVWNVIQRAGGAVLRAPVPPEFGFHRAPRDFISCDENNIGQVVAVVPSREQCPEGTVAAEEAEVLEHFGSELGSNFYCLRPASAAGSP